MLPFLERENPSHSQPAMAFLIDQYDVEGDFKVELNEMEKRLIFQTEGYGKSDCRTAN